MNDRDKLKHDNEAWHQDHARWLQEIQHWQHETHRLVALLYKLEKALPEYSSRLDKHIASIQQHEHEVVHYECGIDEHNLDSGPIQQVMEQQLSFHQDFADLHAKMSRQHEAFKIAYQREMKAFRELATELLEEASQIDL